MSIDATDGGGLDYATLASAGARRAYYEENGYVVRRRIVSPALCERVVAAFESEVKPYGGHLYRQASANPERHVRDAGGHVVNSLLNPLSVNEKRFPAFRAACEQLLCDDALFAAVEELFAERAVLVQSMYFEGNPATWPHQDRYYLDADRPGGLLGAWIALEPVAPQAGRFYVVPGSHRLEIGRNAGSLNIAANHHRYKAEVARTIERLGLERRAPALRRGDVLLWGSGTVHGAFEPSDERFSRNSLTSHFIPASCGFLQYQCIRVGLRPERLHGRSICRPKDQNRLRNRLVFRAECLWPRAFRYLKRKVIERRISRLGPPPGPA